MQCPHCGSSSTKKNGHTSYGKQNYQCHGCTRQFVEGGQAWFVNAAERALINRLLLERISLAGICRACNVSKVWLLGYIKELYANLPDDLNASQALPDIETYLADRFEEEIDRIGELKKIQKHYKTIWK
jgi:hypothetical protein